MQRTENGGVTTWTLREKLLATPFRKWYDAGNPEEWLESYVDAGPLTELRFKAAMRNGVVAGLITYRSQRWNETIWLMDIRVSPRQRRSGVGTALLRHVQDIARQRNIRGISVETQINNFPAVQFYRKHGFVIAGFNDHLYANDDLERQDVALFLFWEAPERGVP
jgi:ribosomal protein S18 acetylase RimI-like enzyme